MGAPLDVRSDIYSIGVVMYEALTGAVPFLGRNYVDTMTKQIGEAARPLLDVRPDLKIPAKVDSIVLKALAKEPDARFQTMAELRDEIEKAVPRPLEIEKSFSGLTAVPVPKNTRSMREKAIKQEKWSELKNTISSVVLMVVLLFAVIFCWQRWNETMNKGKQAAQTYQIQK